MSISDENYFSSSLPPTDSIPTAFNSSEIPSIPITYARLTSG